ncbi:hypothetical protein [Halalkalibacter sp. APA_J-10(15)]|uniref:hypothetical protein n=1 Tax=unclassified Halalkalibacter TaxID=2893063 RepID=UPI001FF49BE1|nr:hypothetical protein [Halalkalibacter sp. APA_J-10(15)]MCK0471951.1 hypothetical protein [Halalkalibacter sp. APA_J-10(15)]
MIDLEFENYHECTFTDIHVKEKYEVNQWTHFVIAFSGDVPKELVDPEALVILSGQSILQVVLRDEGCDCHLFQFTENEKKQFEEWVQQNVLVN